MSNTIEDNKFYQTWQPIDGSHAHRIIGELVAAQAELDKYTARADVIYEMMRVRRDLLNRWDVWADPVAMAEAKATNETCGFIWDKLQALIKKYERDVRDRSTNLVTLNDELIAAEATYHLAVERAINQPRSYDDGNVTANARTLAGTTRGILGYERVPSLEMA